MAFIPLPYQKLLFPTDASRDSREAIAQAVSLALASSAGIVLVEVVEPEDQALRNALRAGWSSAGNGSPTPENARLQVDSLRRGAAGRLAALQRMLENAGVENVECVVLAGDPGALIVETAEQTGCDAIVMATHGRSGLGRLLLGSVAEHVARHASCPVFLVPVAERARQRRRARNADQP